MSANKALLKYLSSGKQVTARQIRAMFKVENAHDLVYRLRNDGASIYTNRATLKDGTKTFVYRAGTPSARFSRLMRANRTDLARQSLYQQAIGAE